MFILNKENIEALVLENDTEKTISILSAVNNMGLKEETVENIFKNVIALSVKHSCLKPLQALASYYERDDESFHAFNQLVSHHISQTNNFDIIEKSIVSQLASTDTLLYAASNNNNMKLLEFILTHDYIAVLTKEQKNLNVNAYLSNDANTINYIESMIGTIDKTFSPDDLKNIINNCFITQATESLKYLEKYHQFDINSFMKENISDSKLNNLTFSLAFATSVNTFYTEEPKKQAKFVEYLLEKGADKNLVISMYFNGLTHQEESLDVFKEVYGHLFNKNLINEKELREVVSDKIIDSYLDYVNALNEKSQFDQTIHVAQDTKNAMKL